MNKPLTINLLIEREGKIEPFAGFTENETAAIGERLSHAMSRFYTNLPLREQKKQRKRTSRRCDDGTPVEYYTNIISDLQNEIEFWQGNCKTAEDRYNKLYQEVQSGGQDQPQEVHK